MHLKKYVLAGMEEGNWALNYFVTVYLQNELHILLLRCFGAYLEDQ